MESILARALEYTLKYWLKSFSRDQFKLQGRTVQLSNLDINGDALHSSIGLPPALNVTSAKVGKLVIVLPSSVSNVQIEPIVVQIDKFDLVLEENQDADACRSPCSSSAPSSASSGWGSGYGFADKIADGMSVEINTVNLLLETRGGGRQKGGAAWASPMASITIQNLTLCTTNENWEVVNLKEARDFFSNSKFIYVFKKLEWESLSIDLLPHPDMFTESNLARAHEGADQRDDDGAKRVFFGGERFLEGISGQAYITVKRTELNRPLGLEVQLHITAAVCPALSEPGLRALLRFLTGLYICLNRGDVDLKAQQGSVEAAGISLVSIVVEHIFLSIKDADFQLDVLMQSLHFSRATVSDGESANNLTTVTIGGLFLRDTFSRPPCTLVQPSMQSNEYPQIPDFAKKFCPPIYPLGEADWQKTVAVPLISLHSLQVKPSPAPPSFASETVISCQPLMIYLQEESCLRISSFLADGIVVGPGSVLPDSSVNSLLFILKELDVTFPLEIGEVHTPSNRNKSAPHSSFTGAKFHIEDFLFSESPSLKLKLLNLQKDPACFCLWENQPIDASQKKWTAKAANLTLSLEASSSSFDKHNQSQELNSDLWRCVEVKDIRVEVAMATADGSPLIDVPPPGGIFRVGGACGQYLSNSSVEQLFFVLDLYAYIGKISEKIALVGKKSRKKKMKAEQSSSGTLMDKVPSDTAVSLSVSDLQLRFLESSPSKDIEGMPLVQFVGEDFFIKVSHRTLGGAIAVSSILRWESIEIDCIDTESGLALTSTDNDQLTESGKLRAVLWIHNKKEQKSSVKCNGVPFLDISTVQVIPFNELDSESRSLSLSACLSGVRLGGGMNYAESLLHRFGILGPDGEPGEGLLKGLQTLSSSPLAKLFKVSPLTTDDTESDGKEDFLHLAKPNDMDVAVELKDWLFALEGPEEVSHGWHSNDHANVTREEKSWHMTFQNLHITAKSELDHESGMNCKGKSNRVSIYPLRSVIVGIEGLQAVKPHAPKEIVLHTAHTNGIIDTVQTSGGVDVEARVVLSDENSGYEMAEWMVENLKFSAKKPIEAVVTKEELQHLVFVCKSEADSMGRIVAGVLCLLKLEGSIGHAAINQLRNIGSDGLDRILTPDKLSRFDSPRSFGLSPKLIGEAFDPSLQTTVASIEEAVSDSRARCAALRAASDGPASLEVEQLAERLEQVEALLRQLRTQI